MERFACNHPKFPGKVAGRAQNPAPGCPLSRYAGPCNSTPWSKRLRRLWYLRAVLPCLLLAALRLGAQSATTGALSGVVLDPAGSPLTAAHIALRDTGLGTTRTSDTDRLGEFFFGDLPPGTYDLQVNVASFDPLVIEAVAVELGRTVRLAPTMHIATQLQTVDVQATLPSMDSPVNVDLPPAELSALPLDGRRFQGLAVLTPLAAVDDTPAPEGSGSEGAPPDTDNVRLTVRGLHPMQNSYRLDGMSLTRAFDGEPRGGRSVPFSVALEGVREFQVRVAGGSLGHDAGGSINTITRHGEERLHGSAFGSLRNSGIGAANPFAYAPRYNNGSPTLKAVKPNDIREQFGGSIGGPLLGAKVFGFVAGEGQRRSFPGISAPSDPSFFTLSAEQKALLGNRGVSTTQTVSALNFLDSLMGPVDRRADEFTLLPRVDVKLAGNGTLAAEWVHLRFHSPSGQHTNAIEPRGRASFGDTVTHADTAILFGTVELSRRWSLDMRTAYSRDAEFAVSALPLAAEPHSGPGGSAPEVSIAGEFLFGNASGISKQLLPDERRTEAAVRALYSGHAHSIVAGMEVSGIDERLSAREGSSGAYDYTSGTTGGHDGGLVDFITDAAYSATSYPNGGCPSVYGAAHYFCFRSFTQTFGTLPETRFHTAVWGFFATDTWRLTPSVQLTAGVRYNDDRLPPPQHPNTALDAIFSSFGTTANTPRDTNNLAPHAGVSYALNTRTVIRLGYGIHFGGVPGRTLQAAEENTALPSSQTSLRITPRTLLDASCASVGTNFGYPATYACSPFQVAANSGAMVFAQKFQLPMVQIGELSVTRELTRHDSVSGSYIMSLARQLANTTDLNIAPSTARIAFGIVRNGGESGARGGDVYNVPLYTSRVSTAFGPVTGILSNGNGTYHALAMQLEHRASRGLQARVAWTYSKSLDNVRSPSATPNENAQFDPFQPLYDRSPSNFDRRHRVVASAVWQPALLHAEHGVRRVANGWSVSPLLLFSSGRPYSYDVIDGTSLTGGRERLNGSGGAAYLPTVGANTLRLPWTEDMDLRVMRSFALREHLRLRGTAEAFNLLNHVNVTAVQQRAFLAGTAGTDGVVPLVFQDASTIASEGLTTRAFGVPTSSSDSPTRERRIQFGLRLDW